MADADLPLPCPAFTNTVHEDTLSDEDYKHRPPYVMKNEAEFGAKWRGKCVCGKVTYLLKQEKPLNAKYCHCHGCQALHGAPFQWAAIFHKEDMSFIKGSSGLVFYSSTHRSQTYNLPTKVTCEDCHTPLMDEGRNACLVFPESIEVEGSDEEQRRKKEPLKPTCHIFYGSRMLDIPDGLPKWKGMENASERLDDQGNPIST